jgi:hypothetical protein
MRALGYLALPSLASGIKRPWSVASALPFAPVTGDVEIATHHCQQATTELALFLGGAHSYGHLVWQQIEPSWRGHADTAVATYNVESFDANAIARTLADYIGTSYSHVTLICASLGGLIGYDTIALLRQRPSLSIKLIDSPMRFANISKRGAAQLIGAECGTIASSTLNRLLHHTESLPVIGNVMSDYEILVQLQRQAERCFPVGGYLRQINYLRRHPGVDPWLLRGINAVFLRSEKDIMVNAGAHKDWSAAFGYELPLQGVPSVGHVDLVAAADSYRTYLQFAA